MLKFFSRNGVKKVSMNDIDQVSAGKGYILCMQEGIFMSEIHYDLIAYLTQGRIEMSLFIDKLWRYGHKEVGYKLFLIFFLWDQYGRRMKTFGTLCGKRMLS